MAEYKYALVALGLRGNDRSTTKYAAEISKIFKLKKVYFLYVVPSLEISKKILEKHSDIVPPLDESLIVDMKRVVEDNFEGNEDVECDYTVLEGSALSQILHHATVKNVDMIVAGNSKTLERSSVLATQLSNRSPCSVLSVPYEFEKSINNILVALDFSNHSIDALKTALEFSKVTKSKVSCIHVYKIPYGYSKAGHSKGEFSEILNTNAKEEFSDILKKLDYDTTDLSCEYVSDEYAAEAVRCVLKSKGADLLVLGSRGRGSVAKLILGSVTTELILTAKVPIFSIKEKGANMNALQALMGAKL